MGTVERKEEDGDGEEGERKRKKKCSLMGKRKEEGKRKRNKRNKWPKFILKTRKDNKNYEITKLPLNTNLGYYILPSLKKIRPRIYKQKERK